MDSPVQYTDAKARVVRALGRVTTFVKTSNEYSADQDNMVKRAKVEQMLKELNEIRRCFEADIQVMESAVSQKTAPVSVTDNTCSNSLSDSFDDMYYDLAAFADIHSVSLSPKIEQTTSNTTTGNNSSMFNHTSTFRLPKRKFPTFSGNMVEWQGFEDLFQSILSHVPELPDVERFEYLKTSLQGEALTLISHLPLTSASYSSAWDILRFRYGNKRDLARIHLDALLVPHVVKFNDANSIKTVINTILKHTAALDNLKFVTRQWSPLIVHIFERHLDYELRARWEILIGDRHQPQIAEFVEFLRTHVRAAEVHSTKPQKSQQNFNPKPRHPPSQKVLATTTTQPTDAVCPLCKKSHSIRKCQNFIALSPTDRFQAVKSHRLCLNCLGSGHSSATCPSKFKCLTCSRSHHTLLHFGSTSSSQTTPQNTIPVPTNQPPIQSQPTTSALLVRGPPRVVLLSTVLVDVGAANESRRPCRALLDTGSQASFIVEKSACALALKRHHSSVNITTFASATSTAVRGKCTITVFPRGKNNPSFIVDTYVVPTITGRTPQRCLEPGTWSHLANIPLADPLYYSPGDVDILLGADILPSLLLEGKRSGLCGEPTALETVFGWVLMGPVDAQEPSHVNSLCLSVSEELDDTLKRFWELEELPLVRHLSSDEIAAEDFYRSTTTRLNSGRFVVRLPFRIPSPSFGDSKTLALQRFRSLELRLKKNEELCHQYVEFMRDYVTAGHMELVPLQQRENPHSYYIPHHCVLRPESQTTKLRVVFNASAQTPVGTSLNESMYVGPKLQPDIQVVLLRARLWKYLFITDIKQMYRQILVHEDDRDYQRILWRFSDATAVEEYRLCTVTYGTSAAPFQALRTVRELALQDGDRWPRAAAILLNDTFVDDILTGANTEEDIIECQTQLIELCAGAQFELKKWASNNQQILRLVSEDARAMSPSVLLGGNEQPELKILGLKWDPFIDTFSFNTSPLGNSPTKRSVLSDIARVFDPLGLLSPVTFWTKHVMQRLWTSGIGWDDPLPPEVLAEWIRYQSELELIKKISIPRRVSVDGTTSVQLHTFSDSSEKGFAAAVYLRVETVHSIRCHLVIGKSKVAPLKRSSIPRLELCGAVLAARLLRFVVDAYNERLVVDDLHAWTDSTTALAWIRSSPHRWATFVANRTSQIHDLTPPSIWRHVPTQENPVDCASRGLLPSNLVDHPLWWTGPRFLRKNSEEWPPASPSLPSGMDVTLRAEAKKPIVLLTTTEPSILMLLNRFSSLNKILRITAYCLRFRLSCTSSIQMSVSAEEISRALLALIYYVQQSSFPDELLKLKKGALVSKNLRRLDPFVDEYGLVRVGGRLTNADIPYAHKHPALLPAKHRLTDLLIDYHHIRLKHPGANTLQTVLQREFWILSARKLIRSRLRRCIPCFRTKPRPVQPKMASLPSYRVQQLKPFASTGVDYAGPLLTKSGRRTAPTASYICLFVCMVTKAIHLELSSSLSTESFLLAFTRFSARRGPIKEMHSDCGTNFVGASRLLTPLEELTQSTSYQSQIRSHSATKSIQWHFNPPSSPHFGGLWEANVKSTKALILRSVGKHLLTGEELLTLLTQIEATLNSRPLCPLSDDPSDLEALTPSHFLTMQPSTSFPEPNLKDIPLSKLQRWRLVNDIHRHFWSRWKNEYLSSLQLRMKWLRSSEPLQLGSLVLIKEATHPLHWRLGRVRSVHPGMDGIARVATVDTMSGSLTRPAVKLCPLPIC